MNPTLEISDSLMKLMGACYIEEKMGDKIKDKAEFKRLIKEMKQLEMSSIKRNYELAKENKELMKEPLMELLERVFKKKMGK